MGVSFLDQAEYPLFLRDYGMLSDHFRDVFESLSSQERGGHFADLVIKLVPHTEIGERFRSPELNQETHDEGVDLIAESDDPIESLYIQSRYNARSVDDIDQIISKFEAFEQKKKGKDGKLKLFEDENEKPLTLHFMIVTARDIQTNILPKYEQSQRSTVAFYQTLKDQQRLHIADGPRILTILQNAYRKEHLLPASFDLNFETNYIEKGGVFIGILSGLELKTLYDKIGSPIPPVEALALLREVYRN